MTTPPDNPTHPAAGEELKPCPFCGGPASSADVDPYAGKYAICRRFHCAGSYIAIRVADWNTRAESPDLTAERQNREAVEKERDEFKAVAAGLQRVNSALEADRDTLKARVAELEREKAQAERNTKNWQALYDKVHDYWVKDTSGNQALVDLRQELAALKANRDNRPDLYGQLIAAKKELEAAKKENERLSKQNEGFRMALSGTEGLLADSTARVEALTKALEDLYAVARVEKDEHYGAVTRAAAALTASATISESATPEAIGRMLHTLPAIDPQPADAGAESAKAATGELDRLPEGTRIRFPREISEGPTSDTPAQVFAHAGEGGVIVGNKGNFFDYSVKADGWPHSFGVNREDFEVAATPPETTEVRAVEPQCQKRLDDEHYCALAPGHIGPCGGIKGLYRNIPQAEQAESEVAKTLSDPKVGLQPGGSIREAIERANPAAIAPGHNPDKLTNEEVGEGFVLLTLDEVKQRRDNHSYEPEVEVWADVVWVKSSPGDNTKFTFRRRTEQIAPGHNPALGKDCPCTECRIYWGDK